MSTLWYKLHFSLIFNIWLLWGSNCVFLRQWKDGLQTTSDRKVIKICLTTRYEFHKSKKTSFRICNYQQFAVLCFVSIFLSIYLVWTLIAHSWLVEIFGHTLELYCLSFIYVQACLIHRNSLSSTSRLFSTTLSWQTHIFGCSQAKYRTLHVNFLHHLTTINANFKKHQRSFHTHIRSQPFD